ncbi:hypothetical protein B0J11DRAFT_471975, partial [Dendryphion nanum]
MPPKRTRQTRLDFTPAKKRKLDKVDGGSDTALPTPKKSFQSTNDTPKKQELDRSMRIGLPVTQTRHGMFGSSDNEALAEFASSSDSPEPERRTTRSKGKDKEKEKKSRDKENKEKTKENDKKKRRKSTKQTKVKIEDSESEVIAAPKRTRAKNKKLPQTEQHSSDEDSVLGRKTPQPEVLSESDVEDEIPITTPRRLTRRKRVDTPESSEDDIAPPSARSRRTRRLVSSEEGEDEDGGDEDEEEDGGEGKNKERSRQEVDDLAADLQFLQSSPPPDKGRLRSTQPKPKDKRQELLELLRRKRAGTSSGGEPSSSATPARRRPVVLPDSDSDLEIIKEEENEDDNLDIDDDMEDASVESDEIEEISDDEKPTSRRRRTNALDMFQEDGEDVDFIDDDPDAEIGEPDDISAALPIQLSRWRTAKPQELFPIAVEWMVMKKINPAFDSRNDLYRLAFSKLDGEVSGLAESKYSSSVWTSDFSRALKARPDITISEIGHFAAAMGETGCEACNRKTHHASFSITFSGKPYHPDTLEPIPQTSSQESNESSSSSSSSDSDSDLNFYANSTISDSAPTADRDQNGSELVPEDRVFAVGSTCKANAQMAHLLRHWRWHLNDWVVDYLRHQGHLADKKVVKREKKSTARREKEARKIVKRMEEQGEVGRLHKLYKGQVNYAGEFDNQYRGGRGR